ncbi:Myrrcad domain-containing protein [Mycoplasma feriruminatoris]|uniref:Myrrcad domain-containing protein n=1 Tax=Mycoplasma feriruminatoris TaxID=1179777 RepID=UPI0002A4F017|nr:Myrrcad domain-containing protein [Mycoplasma feriruminatoris]UKS54079.1 hypothetical protein D500_00431 [Mycoplasma feriruminatoris]VZK65247.1 hypothetical protein MF5292_00420 [Mycoplasma feriruminatoris]VZR75394.1 hypothetical protein MF5294_00422 [Mycoplasma feriruminatoris]VZR97635.1 hypothetical protein MF5293_00422 [Mycoplasma feriruminatoris]
MKKLLTILTSTSAVFLITAGIVLVNKQNNDNLRINYNFKYIKTNKLDSTRTRLLEIGYYQWNGHKRIQQIPPTVTVIAAQLPKEITSLRNAFAGAKHNVKWEVKWDTSNVTDMNSLFYGRDQFNSPDILEWDTSNVVDMEKMFANASSFNQDISKWKVPKVKKMKEMFKGASSFTHNLASWEVSENIDNKDFGLDMKVQPKWKIKEKEPKSIPAKPAIPSVTQPISPSISTNPSIGYSAPTQPMNDEIKPTEPSIKELSSRSSIEPKIQDSNLMPSDEPKETTPIIKPSSTSENEVIEKSTESSPKENNSITTPTPTYPKENILTIPSAKSGLKGRSNSNTKAIVGSVLGTTTILGAGTGAGFGYYYRKNLKDLFLKLKKRWFKSKLD